MNRSRDKQPRGSRGLSENKQPREPKSSSPKELKFHMHMFDHNKPYGFHAFTSISELIKVLNRLEDYETMTYEQACQAGCHFIPICELSNDARSRWQSLNLDETDGLLSIRIANKPRIWGVMYHTPDINILWWDPNHEICPCEKKHT